MTIFNETSESLLVSIIIPTYNRKNFLENAVQSCLDQTWPYIEVIIIDDGSTDETDTYISEKLSQNWSDSVRFVKQKNKGASTARNIGLRLAHGEYIQFLDSDDILFKEKIALQINTINTSEAKSDGCSCYGRLGNLSDYSKSRRIGVNCRNPEEYIRQICNGEMHGMQTSAPLWRRSFLLSRPGWRDDISLGDDLEYYLRLLSDIKCMSFVYQELFFVREHNGPRLSCAKKSSKHIHSMILALQSISNVISSKGLWDHSTKMSFLKKTRTVYFNLLDCGAFNDIYIFECWIIELLKIIKYPSFFHIIFIIRKMIGNRAIVYIYIYYSRLKMVVYH